MKKLSLIIAGWAVVFAPVWALLAWLAWAEFSAFLFVSALVLVAVGLATACAILGAWLIAQADAGQQKGRGR